MAEPPPTPLPWGDWRAGSSSPPTASPAGVGCRLCHVAHLAFQSSLCRCFVPSLSLLWEGLGEHGSFAPAASPPSHSHPPAHLLVHFSLVHLIVYLFTFFLTCWLLNAPVPLTSKHRAPSLC